MQSIAGFALVLFILYSLFSFGFWPAIGALTLGLLAMMAGKN